MYTDTTAIKTTFRSAVILNNRGGKVAQIDRLALSCDQDDCRLDPEDCMHVWSLAVLESTGTKSIEMFDSYADADRELKALICDSYKIDGHRYNLIESGCNHGLTDEELEFHTETSAHWVANPTV